MTEQHDDHVWRYIFWLWTVKYPATPLHREVQLDRDEDRDDLFR
jgi:hypothetical protein